MGRQAVLAACTGILRQGMIVLTVALLLPATALAQSTQKMPEGRQPTPTEWQSLLLEHAQSYSQARHAQRNARHQTKRGDLEAAELSLVEAADLDRRNASVHFDRALLEGRQGRGTAIAEWLIGMRTSVQGWRNQAQLAANILVFGNLLLAGLLLWLLVVLSLRYMPFAHHQFASRIERGWHLARRTQFLWLPLLIPLFLGWGLLPAVAFYLPVCLIYGGRRERVALATIAGILALQTTVGSPFGTVLSGLDPSSRPSLAYRASHEPAGDALLNEIVQELEGRPADADLWFARGLVEARAGRFDASNGSFLKCLEIRPGDARSTANVAANHYFLGQVDKAVSGFQKSAALDSTLGATFYNLSQAYIRKLYLKEGGNAMQAALRHGFQVNGQEEPLPRGAVYFQRPSTLQLWSMAWSDRNRVQPADLLVPWQRWVGVPAGHAGWWLMLSMGFGLAVALMRSRDRLVFECVNCGHLACNRCKGEHEGAILCQGCAGHARRAKSEMVLQTLLRNRRRDAELDFHALVRNLDGLLPGAGHLYNGLSRHGLITAIWLIGLGLLASLGGLPLADPWSPPRESIWTTTRIAALSGIGILLLVNWVSRWNGRTRHIHAHPSSVVSLVGLMEGRDAPHEAHGIES